MRATVTKWFGSHHYGFAKPDVPGSTVFLHATELIDAAEEAELGIGQRIDCDIAPSLNDKNPCGVRIRLLRPARIDDLASERNQSRTKYDRTRREH